LTVGLGSDHATTTHRDTVAEDRRRLGDVVGDHLDHFGNPSLVQSLTLLNKDEELVENRPGTFHVDGSSRHHDLVAARDKVDLWDEIFYLSQVSIGFTDEIQEQVMAGNA
jgi:hypothetical protein